MKYSLKIVPELKIIRYTHSGIIKAKNIGTVWDELLSMKEFTQLKYNLLSDYRNGKFDIPLDFLSELMEFMSSIEQVVKGKKQALIVNEPYNVAASMLFENEINKDIGFSVKVFSTETSALHWLLE